MNISELIGLILVVLACLSIVVALYGIVAQCAQNYRFLRAYRKNLRNRPEGLRIKKMLACLGMSTQGYVRKALWSDIVVHLNRCHQCAAAIECDVALANRDTSQADSFCPNFKELVHLSRKRKILKAEPE